MLDDSDALGAASLLVIAHKLSKKDAKLAAAQAASGLSASESVPVETSAPVTVTADAVQPDEAPELSTADAELEAHAEEANAALELLLTGCDSNMKAVKKTAKKRLAAKSPSPSSVIAKAAVRRSMGVREGLVSVARTGRASRPPNRPSM